MRAFFTGSALAICLVLASLGGLLPPQPAGALDLREAQTRGAVLREALARGAAGDWAGAEAHVRAADDPLLEDIVLWRKLRAGEGSPGEYRAYAARRADWPGHEHLREVIYGERPAAQGRSMPAAAATAWRAFSQAWRRDRYDDAIVILDGVSGSAASLGDPERWADRRRRLARRAARTGAAEIGYRLAARHHLTPSAGYAYADCEWVAGWIALRKLGRPADALAHFERFEAAVETPISQARGGYWTGRALAALGRDDNARAAYARAARHQTAFYGQLAAAEIGAPGDQRLAAADLPDWRTTPALATDQVAMATILYYAGEEGLSAYSFRRIGRRLESPVAIAALGGLTIELGQPHVAVRIAKSAARRGIVIPPAYYPLHPVGGYVEDVEPAFALSVARQETELNPVAVSRAGARGLMQLMPGTARLVARQLGEPYSRGRLLTDWRYNARLGSRYLKDRVGQFGGSYVLAAAAYNAGPGRVDGWIGTLGDPRLPGTDIVDWIESIPFRETRNYVQRVIEGLYVYRSRIAGRAGPMTIIDDLARGRRG